MGGVEGGRPSPAPGRARSSWLRAARSAARKWVAEAWLGRPKREPQAAPAGPRSAARSSARRRGRRSPAAGRSGQPGPSRLPLQRPSSPPRCRSGYVSWGPLPNHSSSSRPAVVSRTVPDPGDVRQLRRDLDLLVDPDRRRPASGRQALLVGHADAGRGRDRCSGRRSSPPSRSIDSSVRRSSRSRPHAAQRAAIPPIRSLSVGARHRLSVGRGGQQRMDQEARAVDLDLGRRSRSWPPAGRRLRRRLAAPSGELRRRRPRSRPVPRPGRPRGPEAEGQPGLARRPGGRRPASRAGSRAAAAPGPIGGQLEVARTR